MTRQDLFSRMREFNVLICHVWRSTLIPEGEKGVPRLLTDGFILIKSDCLIPPEYAYNIIDHDSVLCPLPQYYLLKEHFEGEWSAARSKNLTLDVIGPKDQPMFKYPVFLLGGQSDNKIYAYNSAKVYWVLKRLGGGPMERFDFFHGFPTPSLGADVGGVHYCAANLLIAREGEICASIGPVSYRDLYDFSQENVALPNSS